MPWDAPQEFFDLYPEDSIDLPHYKYIPEDLPAEVLEAAARRAAGRGTPAGAGR